jgi:putative ABC transport system permease protein
VISFADLAKDTRHSLRLFRRSPGFTLAAVAALALGIGANTAIFSVVNAVLLKTLPFPEADRLIVFQQVQGDGNGFSAGSPAKFQHWRSQTTVVQDVSAYRNNVMNFAGGGVPEQFRASQVSSDYFRLFGVPIIRGRPIAAAEDLPNASKVALISERLWERRFRSDPQMLGRSISLSGEAYTVVGIVGSRFDVSEFGPNPDVWVAFQLDPNTSDQGHYFQVAGKLKAGVSLAQANARLKVSAEEYKQKYPRVLNKDQSFAVRSLSEEIVADVRTTLYVLVGAVGLVLLIACANVANLLLVRATGRRREIAIRAAIGAGRGRIIVQLLTESVLLSAIGGACGLVLGVLGMKTLLAVNTANLPRVGENGGVVGLDWRVLLFTIAVSLGTGILFGLIPALQASRSDLGLTIKETGSRTGTGARGNITRGILVVAEVALALVLLIGSALLIRTMIALRSVDPGFDTTGVLTMRMSLTDPRFLKSQGIEDAVRAAIPKLEAIPGVEKATATCCVPLEGGYGLPFVVVGRALPPDRPFHGGGGWATQSYGFFEVFKIPVKKGRVFNERDTKSSPPVVVVNEALVREAFKGEDPLGKRLIIGRGVMREFADEPEREIIGVVSDVRDNGLNQDPGPKMYVPQPQVPDPVNALNVKITPVAWVVRTKVPPLSVSTQVQDVLRQVTGLPVSDIRSMDEVVTRSTSRECFNMLLMSVFGGSALLLSAIGIYGLMAYSVEQRTQEIGIRLALGAELGQVRRMILGQGMLLAAIGIVVGVAGAWGLSRFIESFLYSVKARDIGVFVAAPLLLAAVALLATWIPALRASRVDPVDALRGE